MSVRASILLCLAASCVLCLPDVHGIGIMTRLLDPSVRAAVPAAMKQLRQQGLWLANATVEDIRSAKEEVCFDWSYEYRSRTVVADERTLTTCVPR